MPSTLSTLLSRAHNMASAEALRRYRTASPPVYVDVGASGGMPYRWHRATQLGLVTTYMVDPADEWGSRRRTRRAIRVKAALGATTGTHPFFVTAHPGCSSCLAPDLDSLAAYPVRDWFAVTKASTVPLVRADELWAAHGFPQPDFIKLDVQGFERHCLDGFGDMLSGVLGIELEAHLRPLYRGEALLPELWHYLDSAGFALRHLEPQGPFEGEVVEVNTWWVRRGASTESSRLRLWEALNGIPPALSFRSMRSL